MCLKIFIFLFCIGSIVSVDVGGVLSGNRMAGVPLGRSLGSGEVDLEGICKEPGMTCFNCTHAISCVALPNGWLMVPLQECPGDQTCNAHLKACTSSPVPECDVVSQKYEHKCEQVGIFPDPFDCRKFHLCSPPEGHPLGKPADHRSALCPRHYGYNPKTAQCTVPLQNGQCTNSPIPACTKVGQNGRLALSANHYYICLSKHGLLTPQIFICPHGWEYTESYCRPPNPVIDTTQTFDEVISIETTSEATEKPTTTKIEAFFSTDKPVTYAADTFLADKFDLSNYETLEETPNANELPNSFEDFW